MDQQIADVARQRALAEHEMRCAVARSIPANVMLAFMPVPGPAVSEWIVTPVKPPTPSTAVSGRVPEAPKPKMVARSPRVEVHQRAPGRGSAARVDEERVAPAIDAVAADQEIRPGAPVEHVVPAISLQRIVAGPPFEESVGHVGLDRDAMVWAGPDVLALQIVHRARIVVAPDVRPNCPRWCR